MRAKEVNEGEGKQHLLENISAHFQVGEQPVCR
jgi:hypothetical protein